MMVKGFIFFRDGKIPFVIENYRMELFTDDSLLDDFCKEYNFKENYILHGAYFYAKHIAQNSSFHKIFAIGVSGDEKHHKITPLYVDDRDGYKQLPDIESFTSFTAVNIDEYYTRYVLAEKTDVEKTTEEILKDAAELHEYLRTYGSLKDQDKPLVVSGILLALDDKFFKPDDLLGDETTTDGQLIYDAIQRRLKASNVGPDAKRDKLMSEFSIIRTSARLNEVDAKLGKTPLKFYTEFLKKNVFDNIKYRSSSEDFIGRFYGEFMRYSGGDGQTLGIVLTPRHICDLFCDLLNIQTTDIVLDPCCGTAGFLVAAMHHMLEKAGADQNKRKNIKKKQLHGFELQSNMFAIAATNMILRDDGNSNIKCEDGIQYLYHDDVLKLFCLLLDNAKFRRVFADKYPLILIDESRLNKVTEKIKQETPADEELKVLMITHKVLATQQGYEKLLDILNDGLRDKEDPFLLFFMETVEPIYHALNTSDMQLLFDILGIKRYPITKKVEKNKWKELQRQLDEARKKRAIDVFEIINRTKLIPIPPKLDGWYHLYQNTPETIYASNTSIEAFLNLDYAQFIAVKDFLHPEAQYSTEHGVKGEEYDNVIFVISKGWNQYQFETYAPMITKKAVIPSGKQASFERNRNLFYVCCSRPKKRLIFFVTVPIDSTFKSFLVELVGEQNIFTFSQYIERKSIK